MGRTKLHLEDARPRRYHGFTLVELLVVIGIIAVLISILLPTLGKARESARAVQCLSNIRQLSTATVMFAQEHRGWVVAAGGSSMFLIDSVSHRPVAATITPDSNPLWKSSAFADWIIWQRRGQDKVVAGQFNTTPSLNITYSGLAPFLNIKRVDHNTDAEAHNVNPTADALFRCPSDRVEAHFLSANDPSRGAYLYSYAINRGYVNSIAAYSGFEPGVRVDGKFNGKISSIRSPGEKVLFICQDENNVDDGAFTPNATAFAAGTRCDTVASRHGKRKKASSKINPNEGNEDARGNVGFADGHCEFMSRKDALRSKHSGNPNPDPAGY